MEAWVGHQGKRPIHDSVTTLLSEEKAKGYGELSTYYAFADHVAALRRDLRALLDRYKAEGKTVYCYGAPAKGATLLNSFGIGPDLVEMALEKNPLKFDHYIPGARIPIVDEAKAGKPDAFLVLSWNFLDEFLIKERAYLEAGGEFIVPVPQLRIINSSALPPKA